VSSLKTLCVVIVLSAVGYGGYITLTGKPMNEAPPEAQGFELGGPQVELPEMAGPAGSTSAAGSPSGGSPSGGSLSGIPSLPTTSPAAPVGSSAPSAMPGSDPSTTSPLAIGSPSAVSAVSVPAAPIDAMSASAGASSASGNAPPFVAPPVGPPPSADLAASSGSPIGTSADPGPQAKLTLGGIEPSTPSADMHGDFAAMMANVQPMLDQGRLADALLTLSEWFENPRLSPSDHQQLMDLLDQLAGTVVYSRQHLLESVYVVQPGDSLERVAERYSVPWELLAKINGIPDPRYLRAGDQLKVVRGPFDAVVNLRTYELTLLLRGRYAGRFKIGIGQDQSTPEGEFTVQNKVVDPVYNNPAGNVAAGDPNNPLGKRWIGLGNQIGIHGTNDPQSIGRADSRGCIRLSPTEVEDVYDILSVGSKVVIHR
jgi:LysM repeat protein